MDDLLASKNKKPSGFPEGSRITDIRHELRELKPPERACARCKLVRLNSHPLQDIDEQVWQRIVALTVECQMLAVFETATCKDNGKVGRDVGVRISHIAAVEHHRMVKQRSTILFTALKVSNQVAQKLHVLTVNTLKVTHLFLVASVVREVMIAIRDRMAFDLNRR